MMEKEFLRSFWDEEINSFILKYGESTASDLLLKKLMSGSLLSSIKTFLKSKGLKICFLKCPSVEISKFYNGFMFPQVYSSSRMIANRNKYHCFLKFPLTTILSYTKIAYLPWLFNDFTDFHFTSIVSSEKLWLIQIFCHGAEWPFISWSLSMEQSTWIFVKNHHVECF